MRFGKGDYRGNDRKTAAIEWLSCTDMINLLLINNKLSIQTKQNSNTDRNFGLRAKRNNF